MIIDYSPLVIHAKSLYAAYPGACVSVGMILFAVFAFSAVFEIKSRLAK